MSYLQEKKQFKVYLITIALVACFVLGMFFGKKNSVDIESLRLENNESEFSEQDIIFLKEIWDKIKGKYVGEIPEEAKVIEGAAKGMVESLDDPYTVYWNKKESQDFLADMEGSFEGIGAEIGIRNQVLTVISPLDGMPAQTAGIKSGDKIIQINEEITTEMTLDEAVSKIRGPKGSQVKLIIIREGNGDNDPLEFEITRDKIDIKSVSWEKKDNQLAYLRISSFLKDSEDEFFKVAQEIEGWKAEGIILDLRNNSGGYLEIAVDIASYFLSSGSLVVKEDYGDVNKSKNTEHYTTNKLNKKNLEKYPLVVLVNQGTASSAEILAGALRDNREIKLVGEKTFGKGSVQELEELSDGSVLKVTVAKWLTPEGVNIGEEGLNPDIEQKILKAEEGEEQEDQQLLKAIEIIKN
jgi:carboxyl-terminal processing protease